MTSHLYNFYIQMGSSNKNHNRINTAITYINIIYIYCHSVEIVQKPRMPVTLDITSIELWIFIKIV